MKQIIRQLRTAIAKAKVGTTDFCPHTFASITFPSGRTETFAPCYECNLPPLVAMLSYQDGRVMPRTIEAARRALAETAERFPEIDEAERAESCARAFGVDRSLL